MKVKLCVSVVFAFLLVCGVSAFAQDLNVNGNVNLLSPNYAYRIDGNNVLRVFQTATDGSNLYLGKGAGVNFNGVNSSPTRYPNAFLGNFAGRNTQNGIGGNTAVGYAAGANNVLGNYNTYLGYKAAGAYQNGPASASSGGSNTIVGYQSGYNLTSGDANTFLGTQAGYTNAQGSSNTFLGTSAGYSNTRGGSNTFLGVGAGYSNTQGGRNIFVGEYAGASSITATDNVFIGYNAGRYNNQGGKRNIFIGAGAGTISPGDNNIYIGSPGQWEGNFEENTIRIGDPKYFGNAHTAAYIDGVYGADTDPNYFPLPIYIDANGKLGTGLGQESPQEKLIKAQQQQIADLQQRVSRLEALIAKK
jgi:hypothetical protein